MHEYEAKLLMEKLQKTITGGNEPEKMVPVKNDESTKNIAELVLRSDRQARGLMAERDRLKREMETDGFLRETTPV